MSEGNASPSEGKKQARLGSQDAFASVDPGERLASSRSSGSGSGPGGMRPVTSKRTLSSGATRMLTAQITQQEIMRQVIQDESLSGDSFSKVFTPTSVTPGTKMEELQALTSGEEILAAMTTQSKNHQNLKRTVHIISKDLKKTGVSRRHLLRAVMEDERQFKTCLGMPLTLVFATLFIAYFQFYYSTSAVFVQETALREKIGSEIFDATTQVESLLWLRDHMTPWLWTISNVPGAVSTDSVALRQQLVGGIMVRTGRGTVTAPCEKALKPLNGKNSSNCFGTENQLELWHGWKQGRRLSEHESPMMRSLYSPSWWRARPRSNEDRAWQQEVQRRERDHRQQRGRVAEVDRRLSRFYTQRAGLPLPTRRLQQPTLTKEQDHLRQRRLKEIMYGYVDAPVEVDGAIFSMEIPMSKPFHKVHELLTSMIKEPTMDEATTFFGIEFLIRNERTSPAMATFCMVNFMFSRGGGVYVEVSLQTLVLDLSMQALGVLLLFSIGLLRLTVMTTITSFLSAKRGAFKSTFFRFRNIVDVLIIVGGWVALVLIVLEASGVQSFKNLWDDYQKETARTADADREAFDAEWIRKIFSNMEGTRMLSNNLISFVAGYTFLLLMRFLVSTVGHPRLAVLTRTLIHGAQDFFHLFLVLLLVFMAYVLTGHILMGYRIEAFSTFKGAFGHCLQIIFQRQFDYIQTTDENMAANAFWIITFVLAVMLVMVNLLLAMVFDNYAFVRDGVGKDETIWAFCKRLVTQLRLQSAWVSNTDLLVKLSAIPVGDTPTLLSVKRQFPELTDPQLELLFSHAVNKHSQALAETSKTSFPEYIAGLLLAISNTRKGLRMMQNANREKKEKRKKDKEAKKSEPASPAAAEAAALDDVKVELPEPEQKAGGYLNLKVGAGGDGGSPSVSQDAPLPVPEKVPPASNVPPAEPPLWATTGLLESLKQQQAMMERTFVQMEYLKASLEARGLAGRAGYSAPRPGEPDMEEWREACYSLKQEPTVDATKGRA